MILGTKAKVNIDKEQVLLGSLLGDGGIYYSTPRSKNPIYMENHSLKQQDYLLWKQLFLPFDTRYYKYQGKKGKKMYSMCRIYSRSLPMLKKYHKWKYEGGITKIITRLNAVGLLIWYLDEGYYVYPQGASSLCTHGFSYSINLFIQNWLLNKYKIEFKITKQKAGNQIYFYLHGRQKATKNLLELFKPYMFLVPESMHYKFGLDINKTEKMRKRDKKYRQEHKKEKLVYNKKYYQEHKEEFLVKKKKYRQEHREEKLVYNKKYYQEHKKEESAYHKKYREEHKEMLLRKRKKYYQEYKEEILVKAKKRYQKHRKEISAIRKKYYQEHREQKIIKQREYRLKHRQNKG